MSVINTNITSMIAQQNLSSSKGDLTTAMERLSSGLRINSAKDDAAGQAIANRMSAQITGLAQAQRNANDGISVAQTTEGALNQVNDNLQRIRELTVQATNGTNSAEDLDSIQNEIGQRLNEINRISEETSFNGVKVLQEDNSLKIQVGSNDGETISLNLKEINSSSIGVGNFNVNAMMSSDSIGTDALNTIALDSTYETKLSTTIQANSDADINVDIQANSVDLTDSEQDSGITAVGVYDATGGSNTSGFVAKGSDGNFYDIEKNDVGGYYFDTSKGPTDSTTNISSDPSSVSYVNATEAAITTDTNNITNPSDSTDTDFFSDKTIYRRNDVTDAEAAASGSGYAIKGNDGNFYALTLTASDAVADPDNTNDTATFTVTGGSGTPANWVQVSENNVVAGGTTDFIVDTSTPPSVTDDLYNVAVDPADVPTADGLYALSAGGYAVKGNDGNFYAATPNTTTGEVTWNSASGALDAATVDTSAEVTKLYEAPTAAGLYAKADESGYVVKGSDGNYYEADIDSDTGNVSWDSSTAAVAAADVDETTSLNEIVTSTSNEAAVTGLASNESLHEVKDADGNVTGYVVKGEDSYGNVTYNAADVEVNASNEAVVTKGEAKTVDALGTLDSALKTVDALRSDLGAIQNRFESAITNLSTTETNLSAAKSRIEDADYATEVANMTRSQILQQAGTSVLAQANQLPQSVLSLLG